MTIWNGNIKGIGNVRPIFGGRDWDMRTYIYNIIKNCKYIRAEMGGKLS
jgi:hypothetical protein